MIYFLARTVAAPDGGSRAGADFLEHMLAPGRDVTVVCSDRCELPGDRGGEPHPAPRWLVPPRPRDKWPPITSPKSLVRRLLDDINHDIDRLRIERALRRDPPVLAVHNGFPRVKPGSVQTEILERSPSRVIIIHSGPETLDFHTRFEPSWTREWVGERLRAADGVVFVTPQIRDSWSRVAGLEASRTFVIPNTIREEEAQRVLAMDKRELRRALDLPLDAFLVSCVARVTLAKGQHVLVEALPAMVQSVPNLCVVLVGPVMPDGEQLPSRIEALGLGGHVRFVGSRDDAYSFIRASDMLVHPSLAEGQGLVVLEAMAIGTPVLATDVGGIPFAIEHGESGWLVPANDARALAAGFRALAEDSELRERFINAARDRYWSEFPRARQHARVQSVIGSCYEEALHKRRTRQ